MVEKLSPFLKWAGGKEQELKYILPLIPPFETYYEPFIGGGAVFFSIQARKKIINDKAPELFNLYTMIAEQNADFFHTLDMFVQHWKCLSSIVDNEATYLVELYTKYSLDECSEEELQHKLLTFIQQHKDDFQEMFAAFGNNNDNFMRELRRNLFGKTRRMKKLELRKWKLPEQDIVDNIECALKSAFYMHLRYLYNHITSHAIPRSVAAAIFFFVRENAYAAMFRYNRRGEFNVPYGGISYNRKDLARKVAYMRSPTLQRYA